MSDPRLDALLFVGLPYVALVVFIAGSVLRYRRDRFSYSALSSQLLESRGLPWGTVPWHLGVVVLLLGHLLPFLAPEAWRSLASHRPFLLAVETVGVAAAVLALGGLGVLLVRRVTSAMLQGVTTWVDLLVLALLLLQVTLGLGVAVLHRWGALWSTGTTTPYLWSLLTLHPDLSYVAPMPALVQVHLVGAWLILLLVPFSRLVHAFSIPVGYLFRPPQRVIWASRKRIDRAMAAERRAEGRRFLLKGLVAGAGATALLGIGVLGKLVGFFRGPEMTLDEEAGLLRKRLKRLQMTAEERQLELERLRSPTIRVARLGELSREEGTYFIDYQMRPAMAFRDASGLPLLISAKCTHLGCTVASRVDAKGRLLCPCHISYFDLHTGEPFAGSPAKAPLPILGWVLQDAEGRVVATRNPNGEMVGEPDPERLDGYDVFIARQFEQEA